jgi:hypothetical protein
VFTLIKWTVGAGVLVWLATTYGPMLGIPPGPVQQITTTLDKTTATVDTAEQKAKAEAALKEIAPTPEQLRAKASQLLPLATDTIQEGEKTLLDAAVQLREGMKQP